MTPEESALINKEHEEIQKLRMELDRMRDKQIYEQERLRVQHANLVGAHRIEHEKQIYLQNQKQVQTSKLDSLLMTEGVAKVTGMPIDCVEPDMAAVWDCWKYRE